MFARKRDPEQPPLNATYADFTAGHEGPVFVVDWGINDRIDQRARMRPRHGELRPLFRNGRKPDV